MIDDENSNLIRRASIASVGIACFLIIIKLVAFLLTNSIALLATLIDSLLDAAASIINMVALRHSLSPADREHRFGHGKAEALAGLGQAAFISGSAFFLIFEAGGRLLNPQVVTHSSIGIIVMVLSICLTLGLVKYQQYVVKKTNSLAIGADSLHYMSDLLVNLFVIIALVLNTKLGWVLADPIFGLAVSCFVLYSAWRIVKRSVDHLMDHEVSDEERAKIISIVADHSQVINMHDLRTRQSGQTVFIQLHLELSGCLTLKEAHKVSEEVEFQIKTAFPNSEILIHEDPDDIAGDRRKMPSLIK
ncbi:MAG: cation diffusion facilitator family transporter [Gammaproteobacteria bacterium]